MDGEGSDLFNRPLLTELGDFRWDIWGYKQSAPDGIKKPFHLTAGS
jgi:hypothetical protein